MGRDLREDEALPGDAIGEHHVVGRDAIRRREEERLVVQLEEVADLARGELVEGLQREGGDRFGHAGRLCLFVCPFFVLLYIATLCYECRDEWISE